MLEKEFRNEDPSGKTIALMLLIVSLIGGGAFAVKLGLQGFPPLIMAFFRCILGLIVVGGLGFYFGMSMRLRFEEVPRLLVLAALYILHTITLNVGTQLTIASRATIFFYALSAFHSDIRAFLASQSAAVCNKNIGDSHSIRWDFYNRRAGLSKWRGNLHR